MGHHAELVIITQDVTVTLLTVTLPLLQKQIVLLVDSKRTGTGTGTVTLSASSHQCTDAVKAVQNALLCQEFNQSTCGAPQGPQHRIAADLWQCILLLCCA